ncbi:MAG: 30S ribosomal protein S12 methylthiotransferase RimO [Campylobacterota bacterium]|nr:30S ribosomal protein S12 methylthiotransferase RimO [Campylobacterota bacterium]
MKKLYLVSLGCTKNLIDSEVMLGRLKDQYTMTDDVSSADLIIVNTCGFIQSAKEESLDTIFEMDANRKESSVLVMAGCLSERYKDELQEGLKNEVDIFTGVGDYDQIDKLVEEKRSQFSDKVFLATEKNIRVVTGSNYHAFVKLSEGCNQLCSFCAIPAFKGKLNSRSIDSVVEEVTSLVSQGFFDFSFVSQDSSSYLRDHGENDGIQQLIDAVEKIEGVQSARILYLYPSTMTNEMIKKISDSKLFHTYYDMPLQHISQHMLKVMKRGKGSEQVRELMDTMKKMPNSFVRSTFIVGHPGETLEDFEELCEFIKEYKFDRVNVFSYSDEEGTKACEMDEIKVDEDEIDRRAEVLGGIIEKITQEKLQEDVGKEFKIIIDGESDEHEYLLSARKLIWAPEIDGEIYVNDSELQGELKTGKIYTARITEQAGDKLLATVIDDK